MRRPKWSTWLQLIVVLTVLKSASVTGVRSFIAHRAIQFDKFVEPFGSRQSGVANVAVSLHGKHDLGRNTAVVDAEEVTLSMVSSMPGRRGKSLLIVIPRNVTSLSADARLRFRQIEDYILGNSLDSAVYFTFESALLRELLAAAKSSGPPSWNSQQIGYHVSGSEKSPQLSTQTELTNLFGVLKPSEMTTATGNRNKQQHIGNDNGDIILVCANHDSFGAVPDLSVGVQQNGSGVTALIALLKSMAAVFGRVQQRGLSEKYRVVFLLTAGGYNNYEGTLRWLSRNKVFGKNRVAFALFLDSIARGEELYVHADPGFGLAFNCERLKGSSAQYDECVAAKQEAAASGDADDALWNVRVNEVMTHIARRRDVPLELRFKALKSDTNINLWHHHVAVREGLGWSATVSSKREEKALYKTATILDRRECVSEEILVRNIEFLTDVLFTLVYDLPLTESGLSALDSARNDGILFTDRSYVGSYLDFLGHMPRIGAYHFESPYLKKLYEDMTRLSHAGFQMKYTPKTAHEKFYTTAPVTMTVTLVRPFAFDLICMLAILSYCFLYFVYLKNPKSWEEFLDIFEEE